MKPETVLIIAEALARSDLDDPGTRDIAAYVPAAKAALDALTTTPEYQALVKDAERKECFWTSDGDDSPWEGTCGVAWIFIDGGPEENKMSYCPQCGGKLTAQTYDEVESEDAAVDAARNG